MFLSPSSVFGAFAVSLSSSLQVRIVLTGGVAGFTNYLHLTEEKFATTLTTLISVLVVDAIQKQRYLISGKEECLIHERNMSDRISEVN